MEQRDAFNAVADLYATARPGYPDALVHDVITFAGLKSGDCMLEIGCGAGQATEQFAALGYRLTALDPGEALIRFARKRLASLADVDFVTTTFEAWGAPPGTFQLVFAAQAFHWIPPQTAYPKAASLLADHGTLAVFGHVPMSPPEPLRTVFEQTCLAVTGKWSPPPETAYLPGGPFKPLFEGSGCFGAVTHKSYAWTWHHTSSSFVDFARTRSDHQMMQARQREALLVSLKAAIDALGGAFDWPYETHLYLAKRAG